MNKNDKQYVVQLVKQVVHPYFANEIADILIAHGMRFPTIPVTRADQLRSAPDEQLATFLTKIVDDASGPWEMPFDEAFCKDCKPTVHIDDDGFEDDVWPCWRGGPGCPHGVTPALWWLRQPAEEAP